MELAIGLTALVVAIVGFPMLYECLKVWGAQSLLNHIDVENLPNVISDGERTYWLIKLNIGKGNLICRIMQALISKNVMTEVRFEPLTGNNGDKYTSKAYEVNLGIRNKRIVYPIKPEVEIRLVVVQRYPDLSLRTLGDSFGYSELTGSYRLVLSFKDKWNKDIGEPYVIEPYIVDGKPISGDAT